MANRFARKSGNWNASDVWSDTPSGTASASFIPTAGDVAMANSFTVTVNVDATCSEVRNDTTGGATAGGYFDLAAGVTLTANCFAGSTATQCVRFNGTAPAIAYVVGNATAGSVSGAFGINNNTTGTLNATGTFTGGSSSNSPGASNNSTGTLNITGSSVGGSVSGAHGAYNNSTGTLTISLNATGGSTAGANGAANASTGTVTLGGSAIGGSGLNAHGATNNGAGTLKVGTAIGNDFGNGSVGLAAAPGVSGSQTGITKVKTIQYGSRGQTPTVGNVFIEPDNANQAIFVKSDLTTLTLSRTDGSDFGNPAASDVRYGTVYALGSLTGTCHVPTASQVSAGVAVDATVGTAVLTEANVRAALGLASANLDSQLADLPTAAENATAVWGATTRTLTSSSGGATAEDVWTYATRSLTEAPDVPTVQEIAAEVRTELTPELARVANCATVESTGDQLAGLL